MGLNRITLAHLSTLLDNHDVKRIENNARIAEVLERQWLARADAMFASINDRVLDVLEQGGELPASWAWLTDKLGGFMLEHELAVTEAAHRTITPAEYVRARAPRWPTKTERIRSLWDRYRKTGALPGRTQEQAAAIKVLYIRRVQSMWQNYGRQFIQGAPRIVDKQGRDVNKVNRDGSTEGNVWNPDAFDREGARLAIEKEAKVSRSRARTIVETETTRYYNDTRIGFYSTVESVIGYLFVAVRDHATTKWCRSRNGVVFEKGSPALRSNTPPCFVGHSLVLTLGGWVPIDTVTVGSYVWTHANRWRRVEVVHRSFSADDALFQIGNAVATARHPYAVRGGGYVWAAALDKREGVRTDALDLRCLQQIPVGCLGVPGSEVLLDAVSRRDAGAYDARPGSPIVDRWAKDHEGWLHRNSLAGSPGGQQAQHGLHPGASRGDGAEARQVPLPQRGRASHQRDRDRQQTGESTGNEQLGPREPAPKGQEEKKVEVFNLDIEDDHTYVAGGFVVHNCHYNCRSELLPLSRLNPAHRRLLEDKSKRPESNNLVPLIPGWNA